MNFSTAGGKLASGASAIKANRPWLRRSLTSGCLVICILVGTAPAQDTVITSSATDPAARIKKQGLILEYTGSELKLRTALGKDETIPAARVVEIQTTWTPSHQTGAAERVAGNLDEAITAYRQAKREESRPWAVRRIMAELAGTYLEAGRIDNAGDEFLGVVASDPATQHYDIIPIAWRAAPPDGPLEARAGKWLEAKQFSAARLLGASWLLAGPQRTAAIAALEELTKNEDPRVAGLAISQLWRTKLVTAKPADAALWQGQLERMPPEIQAAGWFILGEVLSSARAARAGGPGLPENPAPFSPPAGLGRRCALGGRQAIRKDGATWPGSRLIPRSPPRLRPPARRPRSRGATEGAIKDGTADEGMTGINWNRRKRRQQSRQEVRRPSSLAGSSLFVTFVCFCSI